MNQHPTILVVDDEPQIRRVLRSTLTAQGYAIVEARDGQEAPCQGFAASGPIWSSWT